MDEALYSFFEFHETTVRHDIDDPPMHSRTDRVFHIYRVPGIALCLLEPEGYPLPFSVDIKDHHLNLFPHLNDFARMGNASPRHICNMKEAIHALEVDERTEIGDVLHHTTPELIGLQRRQESLALFGSGLLQELTARQHDIAPAGVDLEDPEVLLATNVVL